MFGKSKLDIHTFKGFKFLKVSSDNKQAQNLVFLHGMFGGLSNFDALISHLDQQNIYVPEIPLYTLPRAELSIQGFARWLHTFIESCGIYDPVILGNSMGGHIALEYTLQHPEAVTGLVLTGSSGLMENDFGSTCPKRNDREYIKKRASLTFYDDLVDDTIVDEILKVIQSSQKLANLLRIARCTHDYNMEDLLPAITQPALLIWGENDLITPPKVAETFHEKLPNNSLEWISRCGHAPMMERPEEFAYHLKKFLNKLNRNLIRNQTNEHKKNYSHF